MSASTASPRAISLGAISVATRPFWLGSELRLTVAAKATFAIEPEGSMRLADPEPVRDEGCFVGDELALPDELAPRLPRAEVIAVGHAYVRAGTIDTAWLALFGVDGALVDKRLVVRGSPRSDHAIEPIALRYVHTFGGPGHDNPVGVGLDDDRSPALRHADGSDRAACFAPISPRWPSRARTAPAMARGEGGILALPRDADLGFFQAAAPDQQTHHLAGDEWLVLEGLSRDRRMVRSRLPGVRVEARARVAGRAEAIEMHADLLIVDVDRLVCSLVWRGDRAIPSAAALAGVEIGVALDDGSAIEWPHTFTLDDVATTTATITPEALAAARVALPFRPGAASPLVAPRRAPDHRDSGTVTVDPSTLTRIATPFDRAPPAPPPPPSISLAAPVPVDDVSPWAGGPARRAPAPREAPRDVEPPADPSATPRPGWLGPGPAPPDPPSAIAEASAPLAPEPEEPEAPAARAPRSTQDARIRARALVSLLTIDEADLGWFATRKLGSASTLDRDDLVRVRAILESLSDALDVSNAEETRRIELAWELVHKRR